MWCTNLLVSDFIVILHPGLNVHKWVSRLTKSALDIVVFSFFLFVNSDKFQPIHLTMQAKDDDDLHRGQRSTEVKYSKLCSMAAKLGQKNCWCKLREMMTFTEVRVQQRSNTVNYALWPRAPGIPGVKNVKQCSIATKLGLKNYQCKLRMMMMMTLMEVKDQQRSRMVNYALWLPNLVRRIADASLGWWWPSWRSKVNISQMQ